MIEERIKCHHEDVWGGFFFMDFVIGAWIVFHCIYRLLGRF